MFYILCVLVYRRLRLMLLRQNLNVIYLWKGSVHFSRGMHRSAADQINKDTGGRSLDDSIKVCRFRGSPVYMLEPVPNVSESLMA